MSDFDIQENSQNDDISNSPDFADLAPIDAHSDVAQELINEVVNTRSQTTHEIRIPPIPIDGTEIFIDLRTLIKDSSGLEGIPELEGQSTKKITEKNGLTFDFATAELRGSAEVPGIINVQCYFLLNEIRHTVNILVETYNSPKPIEVVLPNASQGENFAASLPFSDYYDIKFVNEVDSEFLKTSGLEIISFQEIKGTPTTPGKYTLLLEGKNQSSHRVELKVHLDILPDPKTLWRNIPSDQSASFWKVDEECGYLQSQAAWSIWASKRGRSHAHNGTFRDDHAGICESDNGWIIALVCDGKGSGKYSRQGSKISVETTLHTLSKSLDACHVSENALSNLTMKAQLEAEISQLILETAKTCARLIEEEANACAENLREFDTTYLLLALYRVENSWLACSFSIGDGAITFLNESRDSALLLSIVDSGMQAGETLFLRNELLEDASNPWDRVQFHVIEESGFFLLMSDGITDAKLPFHSDLQDASKLEQLIYQDISESVSVVGQNNTTPTNLGDASRDLLTWMDFFVPGEHDDRSLVIVKVRTH